MDAKPALRKHFLALRDALDPRVHAEASASIARHLESLCRTRRFRRIAAFWPFGSEVDLRPLVAERADWLWYFPRVASTAPPRLVWGGEPLEPGLWGLMEPVFSQHFMPPVDLLLVPGLAFDGDGHRIGYGRGFYDALLDRLGERLPTLGVAFACQRTALLPRDPQDLPVQGLVTERGLTWFGQQEDES